MPASPANLRSATVRSAAAGFVLATFLSFAGCRNSTAPETVALPPAGTHQSMLLSLDGDGGDGGVSVTPAVNPGGFFDATIRVRLIKAKPNTTYIVQRAPEIGRTLGSDGLCQRALAITPWSSTDAPAASFLTFVMPGTTTPVTLTTSATGDASLEFNFQAAMIPAGTRFDVQFRLLNDAALPTSVYLSRCFTVTVL